MLNMSENNIGDDGIELLSKCFNEGKSRLSKLNISSMGATLAGFKKLFMALRLNQHLISLTIDGNDFKCENPKLTRE